MDATFQFAKVFAETKFDDLPRPAVEAAKKEVLDTIGVALAGCSAPGVKELMQIVTDWGGRPESTIWYWGNKLPAPNVVMVNATMAHALDYDDVAKAPLHPGVIAVTSAIAAAELKGNVSGKELITAIVLSADFMCRIVYATRLGAELIKRGWHATTVIGFLAAAGAAGKILKLDEDGIVNAFGIAYHQCSGNGQCVVDGALTKRLGPGFATRGGIIAALMAEKGITGAKNCLEGEWGLYNIYFDCKCDHTVLTSNLGKEFEITTVNIKKYPCCRGTHDHIDCTLALVNKYDIKPEDVDEIAIFAGEGSYWLCTPLDVKSQPRTIVDAQFSVPWVVATAIVKRDVNIWDFNEDAIKNPDVLEMCSRIRKVVRTREKARVEIKTKNGKVYAEEINYTSSGKEPRVIFDDVAHKFRKCASQAPRPLSHSQIEQVISICRRLEQLGDTSELVDLLCNIEH
ncbi:MAG: MmgE/PrpD family protein [Candidatus Bathyarchaeia archaeon]